MIQIHNASEQKLRGAYYTPPVIADFILQWGFNDCNYSDILEPSCGSGVFLECIAERNLPYKSITAVEYESSEALKAGKIALHDSEIINDDFHRFCLDTTKRFDLIVGNPPFIRYQYYVPDQQVLADKIFSRVNLKRTKLTNAWVTFVVGCSQLLRENGKMGFVIPSELLMVSYAGQLRKYLAQKFNKINIISFENLVFADIQQDVVILLCEKDGTDKHFIEHIEIKDAKELAAIDLNRLKNPTKKFEFLADKWTYYFLSRKELDLLAKVKGQPTLSTYSNLEVGITTGNNDYFTVSDSVVTMNHLQDFARPMAGGSRQVESLCFTAADWQRNADAGEKAYLLTFTPDSLQSGNAGVRAYIRSGEALGIDKGYKTSIRNKWWVVSSIKISDAFSLHRIHLYPKIVLNDAGVYVTSNLNRIFIKEGVDRKAFVASFYNSLSFAFSEILGRSLGGGCLDILPSEFSNVYLPYRKENSLIYEKLDIMMRKNASIDEILDFSDEVILHQGMGLTEEEIILARSIWHKMMNRRLNRKPLSKAVK